MLFHFSAALLTPVKLLLPHMLWILHRSREFSCVLWEEWIPPPMHLFLLGFKYLIPKVSSKRCSASWQ